MSAVWSPEELANRFAPYIEELHEFFAFHRMSFGMAADISALADRLKPPGTFRDELASLIRSIILREGGAMPHTELLEILAIAAGGTEVNPAAPDLQPAMRQLLSFVGGVASRPWNEPPERAAAGKKDSAAEPSEMSKSGNGNVHHPTHSGEDASRTQVVMHHGQSPDSVQGHPAPQHPGPQHHHHPNNVVPFPVRGDRQRWGHERFEAHRESRPITGPDDLPDDIDPNPAEAFASALGARHHAKAKVDGTTAAEPGEQASAQTAKSAAAPPAVKQQPVEQAKSIPESQPEAHDAPVTAAPALDSGPLTGLQEHHYGLLEKHPTFAGHRPVDAEELAREQEEADSDPFFAEPPPPSMRYTAITAGAALAVLIAVFVLIHSHHAAQVASQSEPVRPTSPTATLEAKPSAAVSEPTTETTQTKPLAKRRVYDDTDDEDNQSTAPSRSHGSEDLIAEPYSSQPLPNATGPATLLHTASASVPTSSNSPAANMVASNSPPVTPGGGSTQAVVGSAGVPVASGFTEGRSAPLYRASAEQSYRNPDAALVGDLPERTPGTALDDHPRYLDVSSGVMAGNLVSAPLPDYPMLAKLAHVHGKVILQAVIGKDGSVSAAKVISGNRLLRGAAVDAVRQWRYKPYQLQGKPVDVSTIVTVEFHEPAGG